MNRLCEQKTCHHCNELENIEFFKNTTKDKLVYSRSHHCDFVKKPNGCILYDPNLIYEDDDIIVQYCGYFQYSMRVILKKHEYKMMSLFRATDKAVKSLGLNNPIVYINNHKKKGVFEHPHAWIYLTSLKDCEYWDNKMGYKDGWSIMYEDKARTLQLAPNDNYKDTRIIFDPYDINTLQNNDLNMSMETLLSVVSRNKMSYFHNKAYYFFIYYCNEKIDRCVVSY